MKQNWYRSVWVWRVAPIGILMLFRLFKQYQTGYLRITWWGDLLLIVGWVIGWFLAEADHLFYATMCNPQELTCQRVRSEISSRNWRNAWGILKQTESERNKLPIRNILTGFVMTGVGLWLISSGGSLLASGTAFGFAVRLFSEAIFDENYENWYWLFARKFERGEHSSLMMTWGAVLIWLWSILARG